MGNRNKSFNMRFSDEEWADLEVKSTKSGIPISTLIRQGLDKTHKLKAFRPKEMTHDVK